LAQGFLGVLASCAMDNLIQTIEFHVAAIGLEWDDQCKVTSVTMEAEAMGVQVGWTILVVGGRLGTSGDVMSEHMDAARRYAGWTLSEAKPFWKQVAAKELYDVEANWPGNRNSDRWQQKIAERRQNALGFISRCAQRLGGPFKIRFTAEDMDLDDIVERIQPREVNRVDGWLVVSNIGGDAFDVPFRNLDTVRGLKMAVGRLMGDSPTQLAFLNEGGEILAESGFLRQDAEYLSDLGVADGCRLTVVIAPAPNTVDGDDEERYIDDGVDAQRIHNMLEAMRSDIEGALGSQCAEFVPVSYVRGVRPVLNDKGLIRLFLSNPSAEVQAVVSSVMKLRPLITIQDVLPWEGALACFRRADFITAMNNYDGRNVTHPRAALQDIADMLRRHRRLTDNQTAFAEEHPAAYALYRWVLAAVPKVAAQCGRFNWPDEYTRSFFDVARTREVTVKVELGDGHCVHVAIDTNDPASALELKKKVLGLQVNKNISDPIEWICTCPRKRLAPKTLPPIQPASGQATKASAWR